MNETTPAADSNVAESAPIPWLGDKPALKCMPGQEWRLAAHGDVLLEVAYRYRIRDYTRCTSLFSALRLPHHVFGSLLFGLLAALGVAIPTMLSSGLPFNGMLFFAVLAGGSVGILFFVGSVLLLVTPFVGWMLSWVRKTPVRFYATIRGGHEVAVQRDATLHWADIGQIYFNKGDIYVVSKTLWSDGFFVPRSAFADSDAAGRFCVALILLWKANGNPNAIPQATCIEFAPETRHE